MKPLRLLLALFIVNTAAIASVLWFVMPKEPVDLKLYSVSVQQPEQTEQLVTGKPQNLNIPDAGIAIGVLDGVYDIDSKEWTLSADKAHYALVTPLANNQAGNTFIYGHNNKKVFGNLDKVQIGARASVITDTKKEFVYRLRAIKEVEPSDVSLFSYRGSSILTVQTCSGSWYEKRKLFTFDFLYVKDLAQ
jgi:LPXTG-site transpeptidase (sortase) family protein